MRAHISNNFLFLFYTCVVSSWLLPYFVKGFKRELTEDDMYETCKEHESRKLGMKLEAAWTQQLKRSKDPSLTWALFKVFKADIIIYGIVNLLFELSK